MATNRIAKLRARRTDPTIKVAAARAFDEAISAIREDDSVRYIIETMKPIDREYTKNTIAEGDRVKNQLDKGLNWPSTQAEFRYQGSVTNDTHVRVHSDLDLLVIDNDFVTIQPPGTVWSPYAKDPIAELKRLRGASVSILRREFPMVKVDTTPGKCVALSGGSLRREIDVVIANWWNTIEYQQRTVEIVRGVRILDADASLTIGNKPFYHNFKVAERDDAVNGNLRKVCRFLKSLKYDADPALDISSYDIVSIAWNMPEEFLAANKGQELLLVSNAKTYLGFLIANDDYRNRLMVPNGTRNVFGADGATKQQLIALSKEVNDLSVEVESVLAKSYRKMQDAQLRY
jgi:hypothetical protein